MYVGEIVSGQPHGQGTRTYTNGTMMLGNGRLGDGMVKEHGLKVTESSM